MTCPSTFWDSLAPHHALIENSYLDLPSLRCILHKIRAPVLVVGAGQGLIVAELRKRRFHCDGVDLSPEMIRYARLRRGLDLVHADARAMPFGSGTYKTILYATGVVDFMRDEEAIREILCEGRRIADPAGTLLVAFYRISPATREFMARLGLLKDHVLRHREALEIYRLSPLQTLAWTARRAGVGYVRALLLSLRSWASSSWQEKRNAFRMQSIFAKPGHAEALILAAPEELACRDESEVRNLFKRLAVPIRHVDACGSCHVVEI